MKTASMLKAYDRFVAQIDALYAQSRDLLAAGRYVEAHDLLSTIVTKHAKTALSLRNVLIKDGLITGEKK